MRLLQLLIFALPWVVWPGTSQPYLDPKSLLLLSSLWGIVLWGTFRQSLLLRTTGNPWHVLVATYVLLAALAHFYLPYIARTPTNPQVIFNVYTWLPAVSVLISLLAIRLLSAGWLTGTGAHVLTQWWCLSTVCVSGYALIQRCGLDEFYVQDATGQLWGGVSAGFGNPEHLGLYLALLLPLPLLFSPKRYLGVFLLFLAALALTRSPGCWLIGAISVGTYGFLRLWSPATPRRRLLLIGCALALVVGGAYHLRPMTLGDQRLEWWQRSWAMLIDHVHGVARRVPSWTGRGLGAFSLIMRDPLWAHNEWVQSLVENGVLGTLLCLVAVGWTIRRGWQRAQESVLDAGWLSVWIGWLAASVIFPVAHWAHTAWIGLCAIAVLEREELTDGR